MKNLLFLIFALFFLNNQFILATNYTSNGNGNWTTAGNWTGGVPDYTGLQNDVLTISHEITLNANLIINNNVTIHITSTGKLTINGTVTINNNFAFDIDAGGDFVVNGDFNIKNNASGTIDGVLNVSGNLTVTSAGGGNGAVSGSGSIQIGGTYTDVYKGTPLTPVFSPVLIYGNTYYSWVNGGDWSLATSWSKSPTVYSAFNEPPSSRNAVVIQSGKNIVVNSSSSILKLWIKSGAQLTLNTGATLTVKKISTETGGFLKNEGTLVINSNGNGGLNFDSIARATFNISLSANKYHYVSPPVSSSGASDFTSAGSTNFYSYNESGNSADWLYDWSQVTGSLSIGNGYAFFDDKDYTYTYSGTTLNNGNQSAPITSSCAFTTERSCTWNLVGNPYPCNINIGSFITSNSALLRTQFVYLWQDDGSKGEDYTSNDYVVYNGSTSGQQYVGANQAFFISAASGGNLSFTNTMKTTSSATFYKKSSEPPVGNVPRIRLKLYDDASANSEFQLTIHPDATLGHDAKYDANKLILNQKLILSSTIDGFPYAIEGVPSNLTDVTVTLELRVNQASGNLHFSATSIENVDVLYDIILEDKLLNQQINLRTTNDYSFTASGIVNNRFVIKLHKRDVSTTRWTGLDYADWQQTQNWDNGLPTNEKSVIIPTGKKVLLNGTFTCRDLTIQPDALVKIEANAVLKIQEPVVIKSDATNYGKIIDLGMHAINSTVEHYFYNSGINYFSLPLKNIKAASIATDNVLANYVSLFEYDKLTKNWNRIISSENEFTNMAGYSISGINEGTKLFSGYLNSSFQHINLEPGFNLIGNPFPANLNFGTISSNTGWQLSEYNHQSIYYSVTNQTNPSAHNYAVYNRLLGVGLNGGQPVIKPLQAFWIYNDISSLISVLNTAITEQNEISFTPDVNSNGLKMQISQNSYTDEALLAFNSTASAEFDNYDTKKLFTSSTLYPQVYLFDNQNNEMAINALKNDYENKVILGFKATASGNLSLTFSDFNGLMSNTDVNLFLEDKETGLLTDLKKNQVYNFTVANAGIYNNRFVLHISKSVIWYNTEWTKTNGPLNTDKALILSNYNADASFECSTLTIDENKTVNIKSGRYVKVTAEIYNRNGKNGIFIQPGGSLLHTVANIEGSAEIFLTGGGTENVDKKLHLIGSPVGTFADNDFLNGISLYTFAESANSVNSAWTAYTGNISPANGFLAYSPTDITKTISGSFNQGNQTISNLPYTNSLINLKGLNLISNPYPSTIDWNILKQQTTNVNNTIWIWNAANNHFSTFDGNGGFINHGTSFVPACQGFIVQVKNTSNEIRFTNDVRVTNFQQFLKANTVLQNSLKLRVTNGNYNDEALLYFTTETSGSVKLLSMSTVVPQLYIKEGNNEYAISRYQLPVASKDIPLNFYCGTSGKYTISVADMNFDNNVTISLEDLKLKQTVNLTSTSTYQFDYTQNESAARFIIHLKYGATDVQSIKSEAIKIYSVGKQIYFNNPYLTSGQLSVFDATGKLVYYQQTTKNSDIIDLSNNKSGIYIIKYVEKEFIKTQKLIIY